MEKIFKTIVRHIIFVLTSIAAFYMVCLTFGGEANYFAWSSNARLVFGLFSHIAAISLHLWFYDMKDKGEL